MNCERDTCKMAEIVFLIKSYQSETILSLQYCKLKKKSHESPQKWMGRLHIKAMDCKYREYDRRLKEQFVNGLDNENIIAEILKELRGLERYPWGEQWTNIDVGKRVEAQRVQKELLDNFRDTKKFLTWQEERQKHGNSRKWKDNGNEKRMLEN